MVVISKRKAVILLLFIFLASLTVSVFHKSNAPTFSGDLTKCVIIDAGHGFPDGGAIGITGTVESTLNLEIAVIAQKLLVEKGYRVIMTRNGENSLFENEKTIAEKKRSDMKKRLEIINTSKADMFVSIHMNRYRDSQYRGAQVIYSSNFTESEALAEMIQHSLCNLEENISKRVHLRAPENIFLLKNAKIPAVIVECGFLSNYDEEQLLLTESYRYDLAEAIVTGIEDYYKKEYSL